MAGLREYRQEMPLEGSDGLFLKMMGERVGC